ncbi:hypothetical protein Tco_1465573 [Tanacetum coccineum]
MGESTRTRKRSDLGKLIEIVRLTPFSNVELLNVISDKLLSYSLHYKEIENGILGKGANPYAKGCGEDEDWARNATPVVSKGVDQV